MSSPILSSECASPDLDQHSQMRIEGFLKKGKGKPSERPPETSYSNRQFAGPSPNKLQPLLTAKSCRTHQILTDVEKILGRTPSFSRSDVDHQQGQDKSPKIGDKPCLGFSDLESEGLDVVRTKPISYVAKKSCSQDLENGRSVLESREVLEDKGMLFVEEKLSDNRKKEEMTGGSVCQPDDGFSVRERLTGPGGDKERGPGFSQADENEAFLTPSAPDHTFYSRKCEMILFDASPLEDLSLEEEGDVHCPQRELRAHSRAVESRRKRKLQDQALSQATKLCKSSEVVGKRERESSKQAEFVESEGAGLQAALQKDLLDNHLAVPQVTAGTLPFTRGVEVYAHAGADISASEPVSLCAAQHKDKEKANGLGPEPDSSVTSNSADHFASQILGEVDNFSWDLQSSRESDRPTDQLAVAATGSLPAHPFTGTLQTPPRRSANGKSQSDCNSEDEKFYQHVQENDQVPSQEHSCVSFSMKLNRSRDAPEKNNEGRQEETGEGEQKTEPVPRGLEASVFTEGLQVSPGWLYQTTECQESSRLCRQVEGELTQSGKVTEDYSKLELCEGAGSNEVGSLDLKIPLQHLCCSIINESEELRVGIFSLLS
ncbi:uncharacterized protein LOC142047889 [Chelonoidis abingdonii]|uniref:uncharacterized protein LOC142047889 n=1 Tax=Chelonoidis abingdonii TaxID=106734 RepID=UPI003F49B250